MSATPLDLSVIVCTRNRAESLRETLAALAAADRTAVSAEVRVVDNGSEDATRAVVESFADQLSLRYLFEPKTGTYGKSHALNCALDGGGLGELVVVLDDDMSVERGWWQGIIALSRRWPKTDLFTGRTYIIWPPGPIPAWARSPRIQGWMFSVSDGGATDKPLRDRMWFSGNFFWFRSRVLESDRRFPDTWFTEPQFQLQLVEDGSTGVQGPDAAAGHRIQASLLEPSIALGRAAESGRAFAAARLSPCRQSVRNARWAKKHPIAARAYCAVAWLCWVLRCWRAKRADGSTAAFAGRLIAIERRANYVESLRILATAADYGLFSRSRGRVFSRVPFV